MIEKPNHEIIAEYLYYNPSTGVFRWKKSPAQSVRIGDIAGSVMKGPHDKLGRRNIRIFKRTYPAAHIAWLLMTGEWPSTIIDHRNTNSLDNRWKNLRLATPGENGANAKGLHSNNTSGYRGVYLQNQSKAKPWMAYIQRRNLGVFATAIEAARAYDRAASELYGDFAYRNFPRIKRPKG